MSAAAPAIHPMLAWAIENLDRGCDANGMMRSMMDTGWSWRDASGFLAQAHERRAAPEALPLPRPREELMGAGGCPDGQPTRVAHFRPDPDVALLSNFVSRAEAADLIELGRGRLTRSLTVSDDPLSSQQAHPDRSSSGAHLQDVDHPTVRALRARASWAFGWDEDRFEGLQILRYLPGQEYKPHHDWFDPASPGGAMQLKRGGQRLATAVTYLNDCPRGGATVIPQLGVRAMPILGNSLFFSYACDARNNGDARLLHGGEPVEEGEKWVCTLWMRQAKFA